MLGFLSVPVEGLQCLRASLPRMEGCPELHGRVTAIRFPRQSKPPVFISSTGCSDPGQLDDLEIKEVQHSRGL